MNFKYLIIPLLLFSLSANAQEKKRKKVVPPHYGAWIHDKEKYYKVPHYYRRTTIGYVFVSRNKYIPQDWNCGNRPISEIANVGDIVTIKNGGALYKNIEDLEEMIDSYYGDYGDSYGDVYEPRSCYFSSSVLHLDDEIYDKGGWAGLGKGAKVKILSYVTIRDSLFALVEVKESSKEYFDFLKDPKFIKNQISTQTK